MDSEERAVWRYLVRGAEGGGRMIKYPLSDGEFQGPLTPNEATE